MLILSRTAGEKVVIGDGISVSVVEVKGSRVRLAFDAPDNLPVLRAELGCWQNEPAGHFEEHAFVCDW